MESNRKRRGFIKGKLQVPFYRSQKPTTTNVNQYSSKIIKPTQSATSTAYVVHHHHHHHHYQDYIIAPPKQQQQQKVSFIVPNSIAAAESNRADKLVNQLDKLYGIAVDESVDVRAATYISSVQERFKLERSNSERVKSEDHKE